MVPETREVMEHFKLVFGSGTSSPAKIRPLKNWYLPDFLSGFALWDFASTAAVSFPTLFLIFIIELSYAETRKMYKKNQNIPRAEKGKRVDNRREQDLSPARLEARLFFHRLWAHFL